MGFYYRNQLKNQFSLVWLLDENSVENIFEKNKS